MRRIEFKVCVKCGKVYVWESGGFVPTPRDFVDYGMCSMCRVKASGRRLKRIGDIFRGKDDHE